MPINPITGEEELEILPSSEGATNSPVNPEGLGTNQGPEDEPIKEPSIPDASLLGGQGLEGTGTEVLTATVDNAVVERGTTEEVAPTLKADRDSFLDIQAKQNAGQALSEEEKLLAGRIKAQRDTGDSFEKIFGEDEKTQDTLLSSTDAEILNEEVGKKPSSEIRSNLIARGFTEAQIQQVLDRRDLTRAEVKAQGEAGRQLAESQTIAAQEASRVEESQRRKTKALQNQTQRLRSLRGVGRSTATEGEILKLEEQGQALIDTALAKVELEKQIRDAKIEGAEASTISSLRDSLVEKETSLQEQLAVTIEQTKKINEELDLDFDKSIDTMLGTLDAAGEDIDGIDREKSKNLGYLVKEDGSIYLNNAGNTVEFKSTGVPTTFTSTEIDDFATSLSAGKVKFSDLDLDSGNLSKVITAMNNKLDSEPGLATNSLKAQRILKDLGIGTDEESVRTVSNLLKVNSESEVRDMIATDDFKNAAFVGGNQKLFDDLRKDSQSFKDIDRSFNGMNDIFNEFEKNPTESRAAMEQALIIMFNKMLDPGSVVREGEFDRTSQGQAVIVAAEGMVARLESGGAGITNETLKEMVGVAGTLHDAAKDTVQDLQTSYKSFAGDLGADPDFVDRFFDVGFDLPKDFDIEAEPDDILDSLTGGTATDTTTVEGTDQGVSITNESSFEDKSSFLDFNEGEPTSTTNIEISSIGSGSVTQDFGATSPLTIDNVQLADGSVGTPGIDIDGKIGDPIPSPIEGTVKQIVKSDTGLGNSVIIIDSEGNEHFFNHLDQRSVKEGDTISKGQVIATMGNSGSVIAGPGGDGSHLDYRVKSTQGWIDPNKFLML